MCERVIVSITIEIVFYSVILETHFYGYLSEIKATNWAVMYTKLWQTIWHSLGIGIRYLGPDCWTELVLKTLEYWVKYKADQPLEYHMYSFPVFSCITIHSLLLVDITISICVVKTSIRHEVFLTRMVSTLPECVSFFHSRCLQLGVSLLSDGHRHLGLVTPNMYANMNYKAVLSEMIQWNNLIGYSFFHTYGPDGMVSENLFVDIFSPVTFARSPAGSTTPILQAPSMQPSLMLRANASSAFSRVV